MNNLKTVESRVLEILKQIPETRHNDMFLYLAYYKVYTLGEVDDMTFEEVLTNYDELGMPCFTSIHRARQRVQSCFPELGRSCCCCDSKSIEINLNVNVN